MIPYRIQQAAKKLSDHTAVWRGMAHLDTYDPRGTVLLAGSGRSGTTWLGQIINHGNTYRNIFEPFHPGRVPQAAELPTMQYLAPDDKEVKSAAVIRGLLAGRVRTPWTDAYNRKCIVRRRLIKAVRANLMLGWIRRRQPRIKLLYAVRHPCAVVYSRLKLRWGTHLDALLHQPALMRDHLEPYREMIERAESNGDAWDRHVVSWCIENLVPMRQLRPGDAHVLFYERFCKDFKQESALAFRFLGQPIPRGIQRAYKKCSAHYRRDSAILRGGDLIGDWQNRVSTAQIDRTLSYLHAFGLGHLYDERATPRCGREHVFIDSPPTPALGDTA